MASPSKSISATNLYTAKQTRELDRLAIEEHGIPGAALMKRAGRMAFEVLLQRWPEAEKITVFCGGGNNGGDGYVIAGLAAQANIPVVVIAVTDPETLKGDAYSAYQFAQQEQVEIHPFSDCIDLSCGVIVDALLGTGMTGEVREPFAMAIRMINNASREAHLPVLAVDIPSGLCADTGWILGCAVQAHCTVTFIGGKRGLYTGKGRQQCGEIVFDDLSVPTEVYSQVASNILKSSLLDLLRQVPRRPRDAHKGNHGHCVIVGGNHGLGGAALMAAQAAARMGAGMVTLATKPEHVPAALARCPEVMAHGIKNGHGLEPLIAKASVVVIGPGLGQDSWGEQLWERALRTDKPMLVDADGLNWLAKQRYDVAKRDNWVLTPHPGEASRLLGTDTVTVQRDRYAAVKRLQASFGGTVILKGSGTVVKGDGDDISVITDGNPGMGSGGMGDVLSGIIASLLGQKIPNAPLLGAVLHAAAADMAADENGERGLLATDLILYARQLLNNSEISL